MAVSFEWLIDPVTPEEFFRDYYEKKPLLIEARDRSRFNPLLSIDTIDRFLATTSPCHPDVFLVDAARELSPADYSFQSGMPQGRLDLPRVYEHFASGSTIAISHLHESLPELAALCRAAECKFSGHFQTNIYLSPPNAQGFKTHFDSHDVFVLQVSGSKLWTLNDTLIELPLHGQAFEPDRHVPGPVTRELTLRAGDVFYCPRGLFHAARSTDEVSLHITLGLIGQDLGRRNGGSGLGGLSRFAGVSRQPADRIRRWVVRPRSGAAHIPDARRQVRQGRQSRPHSRPAGGGFR